MVYWHKTSRTPSRSSWCVNLADTPWAEPDTAWLPRGGGAAGASRRHDRRLRVGAAVKVVMDFSIKDNKVKGVIVGVNPVV